MHEHKNTIHTLNRKSLLLRYGAKNGFRFSLAAVNEDTLKQSKKRSIFSTKFAVSQASSPNLSISAFETDSERVYKGTSTTFL